MDAIILFLGLMIIFSISYVVHRNIFAPPCLVCASMIFAFLCASLSSHLLGWDFSFSLKTIFVIWVGLFCYFIGSLFSFGLPISKAKSINYEETDFIKVKKSYLRIVLFIQICFFAVYMYFYFKSYSQFIGMELGNMLRLYRTVSKYGEGLENAIPGFVGYFSKFFHANALVAGYILMYNYAIVFACKLKNTVKKTELWTMVILYLLSVLVTASRFEIITYLLYCIMIWAFVYYRIRGKKNNSKVIRKVVPTLFGAFVFFSIIGNLISSSVDNTFFGEVINYFGRSIKCLDVAIVEGVHTTLAQDNETFFALTKFLKQLGIVSGAISSIHLPFININGVDMGNTYSAFRRPYVDMGLVGTVIISFLSGVIFTYIYRRARLVKLNTVDKWLLLYGVLSFCMFLYAYDEYFWSTILSLNYFLIFILVVVIWKFVKPKRYKHY